MSLITYAHLEEHSLFVVGCSSSEIQGEKIGTDSNPDVAKDVFEGIYEATQQAKIYLAAQCCEHLNRALILESEAAIFYDLDLVNVVPMPKAGGSFATAAYRTFTHPVAVEHIQAHAGMDIGNTFIGMHLKDVVVPCRFEITKIGAASISYARTRPKFIGGSRAAYDDSLIN
ncbi:MAG: TIGR01440 family protein [Lachnospiraceae bacterium]|nr:TIGR01440 family protein [Lachnospiraceae bacterium]